MGWKASLVLINKVSSLPVANLIKKLGGGALLYEQEVSFEDAIYPAENKLYIGFYQGNTIICDADLPLIFYDAKLSKVECNFIRLYPEAEVLALSLNSFSNFYGYALLEAGKKVRVKVGDYEEPLRFELGNPLPEEQQLYSKSFMLNSDTKLFRIEGNNYSEDAVGEEFVFNIAKRFLGGRLDSQDLDDLMFDTVFHCYTKR